MKNISKRIMALVLAVAMMVTSLPTSVSAAKNNDPQPTWSADYNAKVGDSHDFHLYDVIDGKSTDIMSKLKEGEIVEWTTSNSKVFTITGGTEPSNETYDYLKEVSENELKEKNYISKINYGYGYSYSFTENGKKNVYQQAKDDEWYKINEYNSYDQKYNSRTTYKIKETKNYKIPVGKAYFVGVGTAVLTATHKDANGKEVSITKANIIVTDEKAGYTYNLRAGENFKLKDAQGKEFGPGDFTANGQLSWDKNIFSTQGYGQLPNKINSNVAPGTYTLKLKDKKGTTWTFTFIVADYDYKVRVQLSLQEGVPAKAIKSLDEIAPITVNKNADLRTAINYSQYFEAKFEDNDKVYTYKTADVNVANDWQLVNGVKVKTVTVKGIYETPVDVTYNKELTYQIKVNGQRIEDTAKFVNPELNFKEASSKDEEISEKATDYVLAIVNDGNKAYNLATSNVEVTTTQSNDMLTKTHHVVVKAEYNQVNYTDVTLVHKLSYVTYDRFGKKIENCGQVLDSEKTTLNRVKIDGIENYFTDEIVKEECVDDQYDYAGQFEYNKETNTLTIYYNSVRYKVYKDYNKFGVKNDESAWIYVNKKALEGFNFNQNNKQGFLTNEIFGVKEQESKNNKLYDLDTNKSYVTVNGTSAELHLNYNVEKFTVRYLNNSGSELARETVEYGDDTNKLTAVYAAAKVKGFKGWVDGQGVAVNFTNITSNIDAYACLEDLITLKHVLDYYGTYTEIENVPADKAQVFYRSNGDYLDYKLGFPYSNASMLSADKQSATIKYWASKVVVSFEDKDGNEVFDEVTKYVPYEDHNFDMIPYGYEYAKCHVVPEETKSVERFGTYTLDKNATRVWFSAEEGQGAYKTIINIKYVYDLDLTKTSVGIRYWYKNAYGVDEVIKDYYFEMDEKDRTLENVEPIADREMPEGYVKDGRLKDSYKGEYRPDKAHQWYRQNITVKGTPDTKTTTYSVGKHWQLEKVKGVYKRTSNWSDKDWYRFNNEEVTVVGKIPTHYGFTEKTVDGMTFNNSNVTWNSIYNGYLNGFYDNDGTKDGVVVGNYYITNSENPEKLYATANLTFKLEGDKTAALNGDEFVEYPNEDEEYVIVWKNIELENNNYNVYGVRTNTKRLGDREGYTLEITQNLPAGMRNVTMNVIPNYVFESIAEKAKALVDAKEGKEREADIKSGAEVIEITEDELYELIAAGTLADNTISTTETIVSNYYTYNAVVTLVEQDLTGEKFTQNNWSKAQVKTQAINNAIDAIKSKSEFSELVLNKETAVVTGMSEDWADFATVPAGNYELVVKISNISDSKTLEFEVKVPFTATNYSSSSPKKTLIKDKNVAQGSELLNDLRTIRPNDLITRAEFVGVLANLFQVPEDRIYDKAWNLEGCEQRAQIEKYATYIIVKGYSDEEFGQNDTITAEQVYTILARALKFQAKVKVMTDDEIKAELAKVQNADKVSDWAQEGVSIALKVGIAAATETVPTEPQNGVMRMTAADTLQKYLEVVAAPAGETEVKVVEE